MNNRLQRQIPLSEDLTLQNYIDSETRPTIFRRLNWTIPSGKLDSPYLPQDDYDLSDYLNHRHCHIVDLAALKITLFSQSSHAA